MSKEKDSVLSRHLHVPGAGSNTHEPGKNRMILVLLLFLAFYPTATGEEDIFLVFILAGQSNATGFGIKWKDIPNPHRKAGKDNLLWYAQGIPSRPLHSGSWVPLGGEVHRSLPAIGAELAIGEKLSSMLHQPVGIIKIAFDGTALAGNRKLDWNVDSRELFDQMMEQIEFALNAMPDTRYVQLAGLFWMQGESDAKNGPGQPGMARRYGTNLQKLIGTLRTRLGKPYLPVVIAGISPPVKDEKGRRFEYRNTVRDAQRKIAAADEQIALVETQDLPRQGDNLHFSAEGQYMLGIRFADAWCTLLGYSLTAPRH